MKIDRQAFFENKTFNIVWTRYLLQARRALGNAGPHTSKYLESFVVGGPPEKFSSKPKS